ncbi:MAG: cation:proton antiporter [Patescibacteria group bacterium]
MHVIDVVLAVSIILVCFAVLQYISIKKNLPYTAVLLVFGLVGKELLHLIHLPVHLELGSDLTYHILLPILLFGSALHLNFHQFRLQFKTISFLATFGLLTAVFLIGTLLSLILGWDITTSLMFGALISATDPIAVLSLFQTLGGPKRLALIADGESMFNDATAVVLFRILAAVVVGGEQITQHTVIHSLQEFSYVFIGSILAGAIYGYIVSWILAKIENNLLVETTLTLGAGLFAFTAAEHYLHLSGVISVVVAGLFVGNLGKARISPQVAHFVHEMWDYLGFLAVSLVFFFATFHLELSFLISHFPDWLWVVGAVLISRAISIYGSVWITNHWAFFNDEPNIPSKWQHILNWGGLRGVIPLVLVFSLPDSYIYKEAMFNYTFATLLFTLFINGSTIAWLIKKLKVNLPSYSEFIQKHYDEIFDLEAAIHKLKNGRVLGIDQEAQNQQITSWKNNVDRIHDLLSSLEPQHFKTALSLQALSIERGVYEKLLQRQEISEVVFYELDSQLDLQIDAIDYPELHTRLVDKKGRIHTSKHFRRRVLAIRSFVARHPHLSKFFSVDKQSLILERYMLVRARLIGCDRVLRFIETLSRHSEARKIRKSIAELRQFYQTYQLKANHDLERLKNQANIEPYQSFVLEHALEHQHSPWVV